MPGLIRGVARTAVVAGTASTVAGRVQHRQQMKWSEQGQMPQQQVAVQQAPAPAAPAADPIEQLKELAQLKEQGVLTDAEFEAQKAKILAS
jgi:membrane protease subunit (stomatin/prohibitin family)